jgi:uncharacterized protein
MFERTRSRRLALLVVILCAPCLAASWSARAEELNRTLSVSGVGEVEAAPDQAFVDLGIEARKQTLEEARAEVNGRVEAMLALTRKLRLDPDSVAATRISVRPEYDWDPSRRERRFLGYYVSRQVAVDLRDLEKLGPLLEGAIDLGVNQINDPRLDSTRRREHEREALALAVADAKLNAETLARAAGGKVGRVRAMSAASSTNVPPMPYQMMEARAAADTGDAATYVTGTLRFEATAQVTYDLVVE